MANVVIIGGGHVGLTLLADLTATRNRHHHDTHLLFWNTSRTTLPVRLSTVAGATLLHEVLSDSIAEVDLSKRVFGSLKDPVSRDILSASDIIVVTVPDIPSVRLDLFDLFLGEIDLRNRLVVFVRGGQGGQPVIAKLVQCDSRFAESQIVLVEDAFYGTRYSGHRIEFKRKLNVNIAVYSKHASETLTSLRSLFPLGDAIGRPSWPDFSLKRGVDLLFDPLGYIIHLGVALWPANLDRTKAGETYSHYVEGIHLDLAPILAKLDKERVTLASAFGVTAEPFSAILHRQYAVPLSSDFYEMMQATRGIYTSRSCGSLVELCSSRFIHEDVPALFTITWLMERAGLKLPMTQRYVRWVLNALANLEIDDAPLRKYLPHLAGIRGGASDVSSLLTKPWAHVSEVS